MKKRQLDLDLIKVIASLMVIMLHLGNVYMRSDYFDGSIVYHYIGMFFSVFCRTCVPLFVMVSGFLFFQSNSNGDFKNYYRKIFFRIILPTLAIMLFYTAVSMLREYFLTGTVSWMKYLINLLNGNTYSHLWYMYMICMLYVFAPILYRCKDWIKGKGICLVGAVMSLVGIIFAFLFDLPWPFIFIQYIGYFILGLGIKTEFDQRIKYRNICLIGSCFIMVSAFAVTVFQEKFNFMVNLQIYKYLSPITIAATVLLYMFFVGKEFKISEKTGKAINLCAKNNMMIYFIHQLYIDALFHWILTDKAKILHPIIAIPVIACIIYAISLLTAVGWSYIIKKVQRFKG